MDHQRPTEGAQAAERKPVEVAAALRSAAADVLICYLPVGSERAVRHYAQAALEAENASKALHSQVSCGLMIPLD